MFRAPPNISSSNIKQNLEKAVVDLSKSKFSDESWHASSPSYDAIRKELLALDQSNKDPLKNLLIKAEIVSLAIFAHKDASQAVLLPVLNALKLMTSEPTQFHEDSSADNTDLTGETGEAC